MITTYFLATVLGWYLVIMGLFVLFRRDVLISATNDLVAQPGAFLIIAFITLIVGLLMVISHNFWLIGWPVVITILAWMTVISGLIRLFYPEFALRMWNKIIEKPEILTISGIVMLLIGLFFLFKIYFL